MPEFIPEHTPPSLPDDFTRGYVACIEWLLDDETRDDATGFAPETVAAIIEACKAFQADNAADLAHAYDHFGYTESAAGHDFWLTRNHHGAGFWDRGLEDTGKQLTVAAHAYGSRDAYTGDDGLIYLA